MDHVFAFCNHKNILLNILYCCTTKFLVTFFSFEKVSRETLCYVVTEAGWRMVGQKMLLISLARIAVSCTPVGRGVDGLDFGFFGTDTCYLQQVQEWGFLCSSHIVFGFCDCCKTLMVAFLTNIYVESNKSRHSCVMLVPDPVRFRIWKTGLHPAWCCQLVCRYIPFSKSWCIFKVLGR